MNGNVNVHSKSIFLSIIAYNIQIMKIVDGSHCISVNSRKNRYWNGLENMER